MESPLVLISRTPKDAAPLKALATDLGFMGAESAESMAEAIAMLDARTLPPQLLIIDIGESGEGVLEELETLALHCDPNVNVLVIGQINDIHFYRQLKERGVLEYFPKPLQLSAIKAALMQHTTSHVSGRDTGRVITCMSAASGDGSSTLAMNLAYSLAETYKQPTVLVDMDYQFGLIAKSLDLSAPFGIRELFDNPDRGLDAILVEKMLVGYGANLKIIASPNELYMLPQVRPETIAELIAILRTRFAFVIIDVPNIWTPWIAAALQYSDHNIFIAQLWLRSLTHTTRLLAACHTAGIAREHISLVINRSGAKFKEAISAEEFERIARHRIEAHLANDIKTIVTAENQGKTVCETASPPSQLPEQFQAIARALMERFHVPMPASVAQAGKKSLLGLMSKKGS